MTPDADSPDPPPIAARHVALIETALLAGVFALQAAWPPPDVNEAHYLGKAKHYWNPTWAAGDFFFDSADTHLLFYLACGWLTRWFSLAACAWLGRWLTWLLLAAAWQRLCQAVTGRPGWAVLSGALFLSLNTGCHLAGEWVVGGFEAKGLAYALVFAALAELVRERWNRALLLLGGASAFHVLVGGWATIALALCWLLLPNAPRLSCLAPGILCGALLALPGVLPAWSLNWGVDPQIIAEANDIYVFRRLPHHLAPEAFRWPLIARFLAMLLVWLAVARRHTCHPRLRAVRAFVIASLAISLAGMLLSFGTAGAPEIKAPLLRYYWFRLADVMVPAGIALAAVAGLAGMRSPSRSKGGSRFVMAGWLLAIAMLVLSAHGDYAVCGGFQKVPRADKAGKVISHDDWRDVCRWVAQNTPRDALAITPRMAQTFTWYAGRGQVVSWKDLPQDAAAVVRWWRRLEDIYAMPHPEFQRHWRESLAETSPRRLRQLGRKYGASYLIVEAEPALALPRCYANGSYAVYRLHAVAEAVEALSSRQVAKKVYNSQVADLHNYAVGGYGTFVHKKSMQRQVPNRIYRGGTSLKPRLGVDVKSSAGGLIHPLGKNGEPQGLSLNIDPKNKFIQQYGGAFPIEAVPEGLQILQSGQPGHYVIAVKAPVTFEHYQALCEQVLLGLSNTLP